MATASRKSVLHLATFIRKHLLTGLHRLRGTNNAASVATVRIADEQKKNLVGLPFVQNTELNTTPVFADAAIFHACSKSTYTPLPDDYNCKVELAMTSDGKTIVFYHPSVDIPYEHTKPIPQLDPVTYKEETHEQVLKSKLEDEKDYKKEPTIETLSKMFYTTKHRWYPVGQYHSRRRKTNTPKDR